TRFKCDWSSDVCSSDLSGNSAGQAAMFLSDGAAKVLLVIRGKSIANKMSDYLARRVQARENIEILYQTEIRKMFGGKKLEQIERSEEHTSELQSHLNLV